MTTLPSAFARPGELCDFACQPTGLRAPWRWRRPSSPSIGGPQLLYALLIGLSLHYHGPSHIVPQVSSSARVLLRAGVAAHLRVTLDQVAGLGAGTALLSDGGSCAHHRGRMGAGTTWAWTMPTACSRAARLASAAAASGRARRLHRAAAFARKAETLHPAHRGRRHVAFDAGHGALSTAHPVHRPVDGAGRHLQIGTVHDVAQVVAAGMLTGWRRQLAALVKLLRVILLLPVVLVVSWLFRGVVTSSRSTGLARRSCRVSCLASSR